VTALVPLLLAVAAGPNPSEIALPDGAVEVVERLGEKIPQDLPFVDSAGNKVRIRDYLRGRPVILGLVYYRCPVLCGLLLNGLGKALASLDWRLGNEYDVVTLSLDPSEPPSLAAEKRHGFLQAMGQPESKGWAFLTGRVDDIDSMSDAVGYRYSYVDKQRQFAHAAALVVLSPDGRISRYLYGVEFPPKQLKLALFEAAAGKVGTSFEKVLLRCYRYDPRSKSYELFIARYFRAGGMVMIVLVGGLLGFLWRREIRLARYEQRRVRP
jgi:protein SCO1/2